MMNIPSKTAPPFSKATLGSLNNKHAQPFSKNTVRSLNRLKNGTAAAAEMPPRQITPATAGSIQPDASPSRTQPPAARTSQGSAVPAHTTIQRLPDIAVPAMQHLLRKGQKTSLDPKNSGVRRLKACFGWNILDARCDMDASAFLIAANGKVPDDRWFVFYGQNDSPDGSVHFGGDATGKDREIISVDLGALDPKVQKIVFVLTINEAFENNLNFSMIQDAYVRILDGNTDRELVSYRLEEYYPNVTSMTIGELYLHNGQWKFNPVGNGVHQDLAGQCAIYGVAIS